MSRVGVSPLLQAALRRPTALLLPRCTATTSKSGAARTFTHLPTLRPTTLARSTTIFRAPGTTTTTTPSTTMPTTSTGETLDLLSKTSVSSHPALAGCASQMRCGPRATMSGASRLIQKRRHGFLSRIATNKGRKTLARRRAKGRKKLGHA